MSWTKTLLFLSFFCLQLLCIDGYFIDKECKPLEHKLKVAMRKSMQISETVLEELERDNNRHVRELRRWFFRDQDLPRVKNVYSSMQKYKEFNKPNTDNLIQPTIYCNLTHLEEKEEELELGGKVKYLINNAEKIKMDWDAGYEGCKNGDTIAFTSTVYEDSKKHLTIQLCPWYLKEVTGSTKFTNADGTLPDVSGKGKSYNPHRDPSAGDPRADIWASRLDFTLLHELVHALPDGHDIQGDPAYDWNPCIKLGQNGGCLNADSYAFFALGVRKIKDEGLKFTKDGMTVSIDDENEKRSEQGVMKLWNA